MQRMGPATIPQYAGFRVPKQFPPSSCAIQPQRHRATNQCPLGRTRASACVDQAERGRCVVALAPFVRACLFLRDTLHRFPFAVPRHGRF